MEVVEQPLIGLPAKRREGRAEVEQLAVARYQRAADPVECSIRAAGTAEGLGRSPAIVSAERMKRVRSASGRSIRRPPWRRDSRQRQPGLVVGRRVGYRYGAPYTYDLGSFGGRQGGR